MPKYTVDTDIDEDMKLTRGDYIKILHHYHPQTRKLTLSRMSSSYVKERAHKILAEKLCSCIKKISRKSPPGSDEGRRIAYCTKSIFNNRCLHPHGFVCKTKTRRDQYNIRRSRTLRSRMTKDITKTCRRLRI
jgi:hypothetical protein